MLQKENVPEKLKSLVERWNRQEKEYYIGPDNLFSYNQHKIAYKGGEDIPLAGWFARNGNAPDKYVLSKRDVEDISQELLPYYKPSKWTLILDWHCNYQCPMCCYHGDGMADEEDYYKDRGGQKKVVSKEVAYERIDQLAEYGIKSLSIMSMGEILLYPYWREVSEYAHNKGMDLWTITNGSLWTEDVVQEAAAMGYTDIRVSLDTIFYETYRLIRSDKKEYYERAMKLPELLMKYGIRTNVHFVEQKENKGESQKFLEYWKEKKVDSISMAKQFYCMNDTVIDLYGEVGKDYIDGLCTAFGNMQTLPDGNTSCCCGRMYEVVREDKRLEYEGCQAIVMDAINNMRTSDSEMRRVCRRCSMYAPYSDERVIDGWKIIKNYERETWMKLSE